MSDLCLGEGRASDSDDAVRTQANPIMEKLCCDGEAYTAQKKKRQEKNNTEKETPDQRTGKAEFEAKTKALELSSHRYRTKQPSLQTSSTSPLQADSSRTADKSHAISSDMEDSSLKASSSRMGTLNAHEEDCYEVFRMIAIEGTNKF